MTKKGSAPALGRGLGALLGDMDIDEISESSDEGVSEISLNLIDVNRDQPRKKFNEDALNELAQSIAAVGVIQPIVVVKQGARYRIVAGERRFRASRIAGKTTIPAVVRDWDELMRIKAALIENLQREDLDPIEEAIGLKALMDKCGLTQEAAADVVGKSRSALANTLRLLNLNDEVKAMLRDGILSSGHARALLSAPEDRQTILAQAAVKQGWSVRQLEAACAKEGEETKPKKAKPLLTPQLNRLVAMSRELFGAHTAIEGGESRGKLVISYSSPEELQHIWDIIQTAKDERS